MNGFDIRYIGLEAPINAGRVPAEYWTDGGRWKWQTEPVGSFTTCNKCGGQMHVLAWLEHAAKCAPPSRKVTIDGEYEVVHVDTSPISKNTP